MPALVLRPITLQTQLNYLLCTGYINTKVVSRLACGVLLFVINALLRVRRRKM